MPPCLTTNIPDAIALVVPVARTVMFPEFSSVAELDTTVADKPLAKALPEDSASTVILLELVISPDRKKDCAPTAFEEKFPFAETEISPVFPNVPLVSNIVAPNALACVVDTESTVIVPEFIAMPSRIKMSKPVALAVDENALAEAVIVPEFTSVPPVDNSPVVIPVACP